MTLFQDTEGEQQYGKQNRLNEKINGIKCQLNREWNLRSRNIFWEQGDNEKLRYQQSDHNRGSNEQLQIPLALK